MQKVSVQKVTRSFPSTGKPSFLALDVISLDIDTGEFLTLLGPSGCGKSTLLRLIAGLDKPTSGEVSISGRPEAKGYERLGVVFQHANLLPWLNIIDNVLYPARALSQTRKYEKRAFELLEMVGLSHVASRYPGQISGGMQQRAAICRALLLDPDILLMDEPFSALDAFTREGLQLELLRIHRETGKAIIFVTHSISEAILLSTRVVVMAAGPGRIVESIVSDLPAPRSLQSLVTEKALSLENRIRTLIYDRVI